MNIKLRTVVVDCADADRLSDFYAGLLGWDKTVEEDGWVLMRDPAGGAGLSFQAEKDYIPPVWPEQDGMQSKMLHLDFITDDLEAASARAVACGAIPCKESYFEGVRTFFDPAGHPFCLFVDSGYVWKNEKTKK